MAHGARTHAKITRDISSELFRPPRRIRGWRRTHTSSRLAVALGAVALTVVSLGGLAASASTPGSDTRLTNDSGANGGYVSNYNINNPDTPVAKDSTLS